MRHGLLKKGREKANIEQASRQRCKAVASGSEVKGGTCRPRRQRYLVMLEGSDESGGTSVLF